MIVIKIIVTRSSHAVCVCVAQVLARRPDMHMGDVQVLAKITAAASVPAVTASQTLTAYTVDSFTPDLQQQVPKTYFPAVNRLYLF